MKTKISYSEKLRDPRWQKKRLCVMQRDGFACRECGDDKITLQVHHCHYSKGNPWDTPDALLLTLCEDCHERRGEIESCLKEIFAQTISIMPMEILECKLQYRGINAFSEWAISSLELAKTKRRYYLQKEFGQWRKRRAAANERSK